MATNQSVSKSPWATMNTAAAPATSATPAPLTAAQKAYDPWAAMSWKMAGGDPVAYGFAPPPGSEDASNPAFTVPQIPKQSSAAPTGLDAILADPTKYDPKLQYNPLDQDESGKTFLKDEFKSRQSGGEDLLKQNLIKQGQAQAAATDLANKQGQGALTNAFSTLGMRGGLNSANRANLVRENMRDALNATQAVARQGMSDVANINAQGAQNALNAQNTNAATDLQTMLQTAGGVNTFNLDKYKTQLNAAAANKQADATTKAANSGGSNGTSFICSALRKRGLMSKRESIIMTKFMLKSLISRADFFVWYFNSGKKGVEIAESKGFDFSTIKKMFVDDIIALIKNNEIKKAQDLYIKNSGEFITSQGVVGFKEKYVSGNRLIGSLSFPLIFLNKVCRSWCKQNYRAFKLLGER